MGASRHCRGKWFCKTWSIEIVKSSILLFTLFNISPTAGIGLRWFQGSGIWLALVPLGCSVFTYFSSDFQPLALSSFKVTNFPSRPRYCPFKSDDQCGLLFQFYGILFLWQIKPPVKVRNSGSRFHGRGMTNLSLGNSTISFSVLIVDGNLVFLCRSSRLLYRRLVVLQQVQALKEMLWYLAYRSDCSGCSITRAGNVSSFSLLCRQPELDFQYQWFAAPQTIFFLSFLTYSPKNSSKVLSCRGCSFFPYPLFLVEPCFITATDGP